MEAMKIRDRLRPLWADLKHQGPRPLAIFLAMLWALVLFFGFAWSRCFFSTCPDVRKLAAFQPGGAPVLLDRNGEAFADLAPAERQTVPLSSLPGLVAQAFLAVEDKRFYEHRGIDWTRVGGAILADLHSGDFTQGFSTLTMQLARNVFPERIPGEEQTTRRKLLEIRWRRRSRAATRRRRSSSCTSTTSTSATAPGASRRRRASTSASRRKI
jgi:penicillin-binding protein 1A